MSNRLKKKKIAVQSRAAEKALSYIVYVDDNFSYMNEDSRFSAGEFATYEEALKEAMEITRRNLKQALKTGISRKELLDQYKHFGPDPFIVPGVKDRPQFSAWDYANDVVDELIANRAVD